jgi:hypothetical protein
MNESEQRRLRRKYITVHISHLDEPISLLTAAISSLENHDDISSAIIRAQVTHTLNFLCKLKATAQDWPGAQK